MNAIDQTSGLAAAYTDLMRRLATPELDFAGVRDIFSAAVATQATEPAGVSYREATLGGRPALWCEPAHPRLDAVIAYLHGGGYRALSPATVRKLAGHLAAAAGAPVAAVGYRLAPEHPWPAALQDATAVLGALAGDPRTAFLAGESAGGSLAISAALATRQSPDAPAGVLAFLPYVDLFGEDAAFADADSADAFLSRFAARDAAEMLLGDATPADDPTANLRFADPAGLCPLFLSAGGAENLATPITDFAERAWAAGVETELVVAPGAQHAHVYAAGRDPEADATIAAAGAWIAARASA